jgi:O-antigen/teichoic acid export membrane protein
MAVRPVNMFTKIFKHGSAYLLVSLLTKATGFLLLPIITRYLSLSEYGLYTNIQSAQAIMYLFATLSLDAAYGRFVYDYNSSTKRLRLLTSTIFTVFILWNVVYLGIAGIAVYYLIDSWGYQELLIAFLLPFITLFQQFIALNTSLMQSRHETKKLLSITTVAFFVTQPIVLTMLLVFDMGINSFFIAQFLVAIVVMSVHINLMRQEGLLKLFIFNKHTFKKVFKYALGYMPASFSGWIFLLSDRYIITYYVSLSMAGKYSFLMQLTMIIQVIMQAIDTAYGPIFMALMKETTKENIEKIKSYFTVMTFLLLFVYLGMVLFLPFLIDAFFPEQYKGDYLLISILSMGFVFLAVRKMFANVLVYYKKSFWISISGYIPAIVNLGLNLIFVPTYGMYAAAWATLASFFLYSVIVFFMAQKLQKFEFNYFHIFSMFLITIIISWASFKYNNFILNIMMIGVFLMVGKFFNIYKLIKS